MCMTKAREIVSRILIGCEYTAHCATRLYILAVMMLGFMLAPFIYFAAKTSIAVFTPLYFCITFLILIAIYAGIYFITKKCQAKQAMKRMAAWFSLRNHFLIVLFLTVVIVFIAQLYCIYGAWFYAGWDLGFLTNFEPSDTFYYSYFPNQLFLGGLFRIANRLSMLLGLRSTYRFLTIGSSFCVTTSIALTSLVAYRIAHIKTAYITLCLGVLLIGCNPWFFVPYSDTYSMPFVIAPFFVMAYVKKPFPKIFLTTLIVLLGSFIKPTVVFVGVALVAEALCGKISTGITTRVRIPVQTESIQASNESNNTCCKNVVSSVSVTICALSLACLCGFGIKKYVSSIMAAHYTVNYERSFGVTHYLMMGSNPVDLGIFSQHDYMLSVMYLKPGPRTSMNLRVWKSRIAFLGPKGCLTLLGRKSLSNYMDGSFAWTQEGNFFARIVGRNQHILKWFGIQYNNPARDADYIMPFMHIQQIIWFATLIGLVFCPYVRKLPDGRNAMMLAILMISVFLMIFECRARYLFLYTPLFVILAAQGHQKIYSLVTTFLTRRNKGFRTNE